MLPECGFVLGVCERTFGYARVSLRLQLLFRFPVFARVFIGFRRLEYAATAAVFLKFAAILAQPRARPASFSFFFSFVHPFRRIPFLFSLFSFSFSLVVLSFLSNRVVFELCKVRKFSHVRFFSENARIVQ